MSEKNEKLKRHTDRFKETSDDLQIGVKLDERDLNVNAPKAIDKEEARQALLKDAREREQKCISEITASLKQHNCRMEYTMALRSGQYPMAQGNVVANGI